MHMIALVIFLSDVILLVTWHIVFEPRAVKVLREVSLSGGIGSFSKNYVTHALSLALICSNTVDTQNVSSELF